VDVTYDFTGRVALVTGSGSGIGCASALAFGSAGATVAVSDISPANGTSTVEAITASGGSAQYYPVDVADEHAVDALVRSIVADHGRLDFAHNNAGVDAEPVPLHELSGDAWRRLVEINLSGVFYCLKAEITVMLAQGGGSIVNTASASGLIGGYKHADYTAAKHGVVGLTKAAALDYATEGVRVNAICPGLVETAFVDVMPEHMVRRLLFGTPMTRMAQPAEIAAGVMWLCSDAASYVTGHALSVDGGVTVGGIGSRFDGEP